MKKNKLLYIIIVLIIIAGVVMGVLKGFKKDVTYAANEKIEFYIQQNVNKDEIKAIADQVLGEKTDKKIQVIEKFNDIACLTVQSATDEQKESLVNAFNEKYGLELSKESITTVNVPEKHIRDMIKGYTFPLLIIVVVALVYMPIRFLKLNTGRVIWKTVLTMVIPEALLVSIYTIFRIPLNDIFMPFVIFVLVASLIVEQICLNKEEEKKQLEEIEEEKAE